MPSGWTAADYARMGMKPPKSAQQFMGDEPTVAATVPKKKKKPSPVLNRKEFLDQAIEAAGG